MRFTQYLQETAQMIKHFDPKKNTIFVDMDGVLADFDKRKEELIPGAGDKFDWNLLAAEPRFYRDLEPMPYAQELWQLVNSFGCNVEILTAIPRRQTVPDAEQQKLEWCHEHLGTDTKFNIGPFSRDKWQHAKPGDILIDDRPDNIRDWINKGFGIAIQHDPKNWEPTRKALLRAVGR